MLDYLNIPYTAKGKEPRDENFIIDMAKNLYFNPKDDDKGSVINFRLDQLKPKKSKKYYDENKRFFKMLLAKLGNVNVSEITRQQIDSFLNDYSRDFT